MSRNYWQRPQAPRARLEGLWDLDTGKAGELKGKSGKKIMMPNACYWRPQDIRCMWAKRPGEDAE